MLVALVRAGVLEPTSEAATDVQDAEQVFQLEVAVDIAHEQVLVMRVLIVIEALVALFLLRSLLLS